MSLIALSLEEVDLIRKSIKTIQPDVEEIPGQIEQYEDILRRISLGSIDLKPLQRAKIIGCIMNYLINPNIDLFSLSDYEVFSSENTLLDRMNKVDIGLNAMNKLKRKKDKDYRVFANTQARMDHVRGSNKVYFSALDDGKIYKVAIVGSNEKGIKIEIGGSDIDRFRIEKINQSRYLNIATPKELIKQIEDYETDNILEENHVRVKELLKRVSN